MRLAVLLPLALLAACGTSEAPGDAGPQALDAGAPDAVRDAEPAPDADPPDLGPPDFGLFDLGPAFRAEGCLPCASCIDGTCVSSNRRRFCADGCNDAIDGCLTGFACVDLTPDAGPTRVCVPPQGICDPATTGLGTACWGDTELCYRERSACQGDGIAPGYCTDLCSGPSDCAPGYRCGPGDDGADVCLPSFAAPAEQCARSGDEREPGCAFDGDCAAGLACIGARAGQVGVCAAPCPTPAVPGGGCEDGFACRATPGAGGLRCLPDRCTCRGADPEGPSLFDRALTLAELDRCTAILPLTTLVGYPNDLLNDPYRLPYFDALLNEPWRAPEWARSRVAALREAASAASPTAAARAELRALATALGQDPAPAMPEPLDPSDPLTEALARLIERTGGTPNRGAIRQQVRRLDPAVERAVAQVVEGVTLAQEARTQAFRAVSPTSVTSLFDYGAAFLLQRRDGLGLDPTSAAVRRIFTQDYDGTAMTGGALGLLDAIGEADLQALASTPTTTTATTARLLLAVDTPIGRVIVGDAEGGVYDPSQPGLSGAIALLVDLGGNDVYRIPAGANASPTNGVSVLIDLGGDDRYGYVVRPDPGDVGQRLPSDADGRNATLTVDAKAVSLSDTARQGAGRAGIGVLVDLGAGADRYESLRFSQGAGVFGVGVLVDGGGDDVYRAEALAQGAGAFGIGLLHDAGGRDTHEAWTFAQGFGFAHGAGLALDVAGDDTWTLDLGDPARGGDPLYPSAQRPTTSNASLGQGAGFGRRADFTDRAFMSGGLGALVDLAGADRYRSSVFAQGVGFWFGTGILADDAGDDRYDGLWYVGGAGAHSALGFLLEGGGNDVYGEEITGLNVTFGGGHDFSFAALIDDAGDDRYLGSRITLGAGNANGRGLFVDNAGDDRYSSASGYASGAAGLLDADLAASGSPRRRQPTLGIFLDSGGTDTYVVGGMTPADARDAATWRRSMTMMDGVVRSSERGVGIDAASGRTGFRAR